MELATEQPNNSKPKVSILSRATSGKLVTPIRALIFGPEKVGKSLWANGAPNPHHFDVERSTEEIDVRHRIPIDSWEEYMDGLQEAVNSKLSGTIVVDSATRLETVLAQHICAKGKKRSLGDFPHGRGYTQLYAMFDESMGLIDQLYDRGSHVVFIAHSKIETFRNPEGEDFNRYVVDLNRHVGGVLKKWAKAILFARFETLVDKPKDAEDARGVGGRVRYIETVGCDAFEAGNRYSLPGRLELSWHAFESAVKAGTKREEEIITEIREAAAFISEEKQKLVEKSIAACAGDVNKLMQALNWTRNQQEKK